MKLVSALCLASLCLWILAPAVARADSQTLMGREIQLTLIPDFQSQTVHFDGMLILSDPAAALDLSGLPLTIENLWAGSTAGTWNISGLFTEGSLSFEEGLRQYHILLGPINLKPHDQLYFTFPFVNLKYSDIRPAPDTLDAEHAASQNFTHYWLHSGSDSGRENLMVDIPFTPVTQQIDLSLTPLMGEALSGTMHGFRLSGRVSFEALTEYAEFSRHCQSTTSRLRTGDYRISHLLTLLDFPFSSGFTGLNSAYKHQPTSVSLRSELIACTYDEHAETSSVQAFFAGRVEEHSNTPVDGLPGSDFLDGNYPITHPESFMGARGYELHLGKIRLGPEDELTIAVPFSQIQVAGLQPKPDQVKFEIANGEEQTRLIYRGPAEFDLSVPYVPRSQMFFAQFPAILRPALQLIETQFKGFSTDLASTPTWVVLGMGVLLLLVYRWMLRKSWLYAIGFFLVGLSLYYGLRGSYGLPYLAVLFILLPGEPLADTSLAHMSMRLRVVKGIGGLVLVLGAVYLDAWGDRAFQDLSNASLTPITPIILFSLIAALFILLYGWHIPRADMVKMGDVPGLALGLGVLCLYDAFDKSLSALFMVSLGCLFMGWRISHESNGRSTVSKNRFGSDLQKRLASAFGNRLIPFAMLVLILFAIGNDLSSTYATEVQISISPLIAPLALLLIDLMSVALAFGGITLLFILLYPWLPSKMGYVKAAIFALFLFLVFLMGIGTDNRLILSLPDILIGRVIFYLSIPMLIGVYFDIQALMQQENKRRAKLAEKQTKVDFQTASVLYLKQLQGVIGPLVGILALVAPSVYAFVSSQPVVITYFSLLEKLVLLPI